MHNKKSLFLSLAVLSVFMFSSCFKDTYNDQINQEKNDIAAYVNVNYPKNLYPYLKPNADGLYYIPHVIGTGDTVSAATDYVLITYTAKLLDGTLFDTTDTTVVLSGHYRSLKPGGPYTFPMASNFYGLVEGIAHNDTTKMKEGGTATLIMPSTLAFGDFTPRIYDIKLLKVYHNIAASRKAEFDTTMVHLHFNLLKDSTKSGVFIDTSNVVPKEAAGMHFPIDTGKVIDRVAVRYVAKIIDNYTGQERIERKYYSIDTFQYSLDTVPVPLFNKAVLKMKRGGTAIIYLPYYAAYGVATMIDNNTGQIVIPPYSNMKYEVDFLGFMKKSADNKKWVFDKDRK